MYCYKWLSVVEGHFRFLDPTSRKNNVHWRHYIPVFLWCWAHTVCDSEVSCLKMWYHHTTAIQFHFVFIAFDHDSNGAVGRLCSVEQCFWWYACNVPFSLQNNHQSGCDNTDVLCIVGIFCWWQKVYWPWSCIFWRIGLGYWTTAWWLHVSWPLGSC